MQWWCYMLVISIYPAFTHHGFGYYIASISSFVVMYEQLMMSFWSMLVLSLFELCSSNPLVYVDFFLKKII